MAFVVEVPEVEPYRFTFAGEEYEVPSANVLPVEDAVKVAGWMENGDSVALIKWAMSYFEQYAPGLSAAVPAAQFTALIRDWLGITAGK